MNKKNLTKNWLPAKFCKVDIVATGAQLNFCLAKKFAYFVLSSLMRLGTDPLYIFYFK